jgi:hypothetical protein
LPRRPILIRSVAVVRGDRFAWLDFTNRPVTADRTRVYEAPLGLFARHGAVVPDVPVLSTMRGLL